MNITTLNQTIPLLKTGKVGILPTDTVYGLVALAADQTAVARMYRLKEREHKPGTLIAGSLEQLAALGIAQGDLDRVKQWWPNPLSAVLPLTALPYLTQGLSSLAMRVVARPELSSLLQQTGPLITSSANLPGQPESTTVIEAYAYFGDTVDFYVDGGTITHPPSTIIRPTDDGIEILRQGSIHL